MPKAIAALVALMALSTSALAASPSRPAFDWDQWRYLPVLESGRQKPLDTLARETLRTITSRGSLADPETGEKLDPTAWYLAMLFEWRGWDQPPDPHMMAGAGPLAGYFAVHQPDRWDRAPLFSVDSLRLREELGAPADQEYFSPLEISRAKVRVEQTDEDTPFLSWARKMMAAKKEGFTKFEEDALELANKFWFYQQHRMGMRLEVLPVEGSEHQDWTSVTRLLGSDFDDQTDPTGGKRKAKEQFQKARAAYLGDSPEEFNRAGAAFITGVTELGPKLGSYPDPSKVKLEVAYNRWVPFRFAWIFTLVAFLALLLAAVTRWRVFSIAGLAAFGGGLFAMLAGFIVRTILSGRAPVTNLYESVVFMAFGALLFGLVFGLRQWKPYVLASACAVTTIALLLADYCPTVLDPSIRPLMPVLRSNFWLAVHVITIMLSYAAFALALAIGNVTLGYYLAGSKNEEAIRAQARFTYKSLQAGVLLLVVGTVLGAMWADYSWGRFWGWDPKEVWALITLLCYLAVLHARCAGWVGYRGLAPWSVICFVAVLMAWYFVNLLGTGLHNYAFGGDGAEYYVIAAVLVQLVYVIAAAVRLASRKPAAPAVSASLSS